MISFRNVSLTAASAFLFAGLPGVAAAEVLNSSYYALNWSFLTPTGQVPLGNANDGSIKTTINVRPPAKGVYSLTFSAECSVDAPAGNVTAWVDLDIVVNGVVVPPTVGASDSFCSSDGTVGFGSWATHSITVAVPLEAGKNEISIQARLSGGATGGWISNSALVIDD
ncbi:MAG: hypothetical protein DI565_08645 [Ancylobacter novellus]|uniref:Uncharacterized protein n=1 Tax=Ancylobacter novellus TaxID=921 RepID=A0A2W5MEK1_ANCNO|nr:MAG: hypothetical protein DI565_08645 [Ancylobacter novellus]